MSEGVVLIGVVGDVVVGRLVDATFVKDSVWTVDSVDAAAGPDDVVGGVEDNSPTP